MATPLKPLVNRGLGPNLAQLQRTGDGQSSPGPGTRSIELMQGDVDASTAGGLREDSPGKYAHLPEPMRSLIGRTMDDNNDAPVL